MIFIYEVNGVVKYGVVANNDESAIKNIIPDGVDYFIKDESELPPEPIDTWCIEDGVIKVDQQKLIEFNRKNMPTLTPIEFDIKLVNAELYDQVQSLIHSDVKLKIAYTRATFFSRTDPFIDQARIALNLTDEQVDEMWTS